MLGKYRLRGEDDELVDGGFGGGCWGHCPDMPYIIIRYLRVIGLC